MGGHLPKGRTMCGHATICPSFAQLVPNVDVNGNGTDPCAHTGHGSRGTAARSAASQASEASASLACQLSKMAKASGVTIVADMCEVQPCSKTAPAVTGPTRGMRCPQDGQFLWNAFLASAPTCTGGGDCTHLTPFNVPDVHWLRARPCLNCSASLAMVARTPSCLSCSASLSKKVTRAHATCVHLAQAPH